MKRKLIILLNIIVITISAIAQDNTIIFEKHSHDFGTISEDGDSQTCIFHFTNKGKKAIAVTQVQTTCGCAVANYTRKPILPNQTGKISITYNPQGRAGKFNRSALVSFSGFNEKIKLYVFGTVTPGVERKYKTFPYVMGNLQLKTTSVRFNPMRGEEQEQNIVIVNSGKIPLKLQFHSSDTSLSCETEPDILAPKSTGEIHIIRKADNTSSRTKCIRLKEKSMLHKKDGYVYIEIVTEKCK